MKFLVLYKTPVSVLEKWMETDPAVRKEMEEKMKNDWNAWLEKNKGLILETAGAGKTKLVTKDGVSDTKNDLMLYSIVEADSHEAAATAFESNPHFEIPEGTIEVMISNPLTGM